MTRLFVIDYLRFPRGPIPRKIGLIQLFVNIESGDITNSDPDQT